MITKETTYLFEIGALLTMFQDNTSFCVFRFLELFSFVNHQIHPEDMHTSMIKLTMSSKFAQYKNYKSRFHKTKNNMYYNLELL